MDVLKLLTSKVGNRKLLSFTWSLSFILANLVIYFFFALFTNLNVYDFVLVSLIAFILIGEMPRWKSAIALLVIATLTLYNIYYAVGLGVILFIIYILSVFAYWDRTHESLGINGMKEGIGILFNSVFKFIIGGFSRYFLMSRMLYFHYYSCGL